MLTKRIIPCLDVKDGQTVKGVNFENLRQAGDPVELAARYAAEGADELVLLDISATLEGRETIYDLADQVARELDIPFTIGGGISSVDKVGKLLDCGADKISINSAALRTPSLIDSLARDFGSQFVVVAVDARQVEDQWLVHTHGGTRATTRELMEWALEVEGRGAGEILFTSMDHDGTKEGFACEMCAHMSEQLSIPIIASGGAGSKQHFSDAFIHGKADAALAASVFHFGQITIPDLKEYLYNQQIPVRR